MPRQFCLDSQANRAAQMDGEGGAKVSPVVPAPRCAALQPASGFEAIRAKMHYDRLERDAELPDAVETSFP